MKTETKIYGVGLIVLAIYLLTRIRGVSTAYASPAVTLPGLPNMSYILPAPIMGLPTGSNAPGNYDWLGEQCGCDSLGAVDAIIIDTIKYTRQSPSYQYIPSDELDYVQALKGAANLTQNIIPPPPIVYQAAVPSFWWGWKGLSRVIYTSDGFILPITSQDQGGMNRPAALNTRTWSDVSPGHNAITKITVIRFNAQDYVLDASRSTGL